MKAIEVKLVYLSKLKYDDLLDIQYIKPKLIYLKHMIEKMRRGPNRITDAVSGLITDNQLGLKQLILRVAHGEPLHRLGDRAPVQLRRDGHRVLLLLNII